MRVRPRDRARLGIASGNGKGRRDDAHALPRYAAFLGGDGRSDTTLSEGSQLCKMAVSIGRMLARDDSLADCSRSADGLVDALYKLFALLLRKRLNGPLPDQARID